MRILYENRDLDMERSAGTRRVLILMSESGGGHRAAAEAIQEGLVFLYGDTVSVTIVDAWKHCAAWPINRLANSYGWIVNKAVWLWQGLWLLGRKPNLVNISLKSIYPFVAPGLCKLFRDHRPQVVVTVHPLMTLHPLMLIQRARLNIPFVTVVTDMVCGYHTWYQPQTTLCLVPTESAQNQALDLGVPAEKVEVVGQPVGLKFAAGFGEKTHLRRKLGVDQERPLVLISGGGEGYGRVYEIARCIASQVSQAQLIIVAGRNKALKRKLEMVEWEIPTTIFGFVNNMPELMGATDVFITKAGPSSISEAFITRLPLIIYDYIPGQEENNVSYVERHNAGIYNPNPEKIAQLLSDWLRPGNPILAQMAQTMVKLAKPEAALTIARRVYNLIP